MSEGGARHARHARLVQAGAGSGKTYRIAQELVRGLADGTYRPERIVATTFLKKAAAELKDRIRERLLRPEPGDPELPVARRLELVAGLDQALIGTVHSVATRLLGRYALMAGLSPNLRSLEEEAKQHHLQRIQEELPPEATAELTRLARRLGQDDPQAVVLRLLDEKRSNDMSDDAFAKGLGASIDRYNAIIGGQCAAQSTSAEDGGATAPPSFDALYDLAAEVAADVASRVAAGGDTTKKTAEALEVVAGIARRRSGTWGDWAALSAVTPGAKSKAAFAPVVHVARCATVHPQLHQDLRDYAAALVQSVLDLQTHYQRYKAERGLIDFVDQEALLLRLLRDSRIRPDLLGSLDLVVVDEFQDTNPIQLAIFQQLAAAVPMLWVGDAKQAIYGFRGTDAALMQRVADTVPAANRDNLPSNWRSRPGLVHLANALFEPLFGPGTALAPQRDGDAVLERWRLASGRSNKAAKAARFAARMQELTATIDPADMAVLVRTNRDAQAVAEALQDAGVAAAVGTPGLLATREGMAMLAGLRLANDRRDQLAIALLRQLDDEAATPEWFTEALADPDGDLAPAGLGDLLAINTRSRSPAATAQAVAEALRLPERVGRWGSPAKRLANVDACLRLAARYEEEMAQEGKAATLTGLIYWLEHLKSEGLDSLPEPKGVPAVTVTTFHRAKGLEWPTVILYLDGRVRPPDPFGIHVGGGDASNDDPLAGRTITHWPYPFGTTPRGGLRKEACGLGDAIAASPEHDAWQAATDAEDRRILYVAFTRARDRLILATGDAQLLTLLGDTADLLPNPDDPVEAAPHPTIAGLTHAVRDLEADPVPALLHAPTTPWFDDARGSRQHPPRWFAPSQAPPVAATAAATPLPGPHPFPGLRDVDWTALGQAVHGYLASLPAMAGLDDDARRRHATACLYRWDQAGVIEADHLVQAGKRLQAWVDQVLPEAAWHVEVPAIAPRAAAADRFGDAGAWRGFIDLLLVSDHGALIVDHKSADWSASGWEEKAATYGGQLRAYRNMIIGGTRRDAATAIHLPLGGGVVRVALQDDSVA